MGLHSVAGSLIVGAALLAACGPRPALDPEPPTSDVVVLVEDVDSGELGSAVVSGQLGSVILDSHQEVAESFESRPPSLRGVVTDTDFALAYGNVIATLPPPPIHFVLYFLASSIELTDESEALLPTILSRVTERPASYVVLVGHTDTVDSNDANYRQGLERATRVKTLLVGAGLGAASIRVVSHGEENLKVPTEDDTDEAANRRVEIIIP